MEPDPLRKCKQCGKEAYTEEDLDFFVNSPDSLYKKRNLCTSCHYNKSNNNCPKKMRDWKTKHQVMKRYGVTPEEYAKRMATSDCCEICGKTENLCYDHCHDTMKFRGVLCRGCNRSIGQLGDTLQSIMKVVEYLRKDDAKTNNR